MMRRSPTICTIRNGSRGHCAARRNELRGTSGRRVREKMATPIPREPRTAAATVRMPERIRAPSADVVRDRRALHVRVACVYMAVRMCWGMRMCTYIGIHAYHAVYVAGCDSLSCVILGSRDPRLACAFIVTGSTGSPISVTILPRRWQYCRVRCRCANARRGYR